MVDILKKIRKYERLWWNVQEAVIGGLCKARMDVPSAARTGGTNRTFSQSKLRGEFQEAACTEEEDLYEYLGKPQRLINNRRAGNLTLVFSVSLTWRCILEQSLE